MPSQSYSSHDGYQSFSADPASIIAATGAKGIDGFTCLVQNQFFVVLQPVLRFQGESGAISTLLVLTLPVAGTHIHH